MSLEIHCALEDKGFQDINPLICGVENCEKGHSFGPHVRNYYLLHYVLSGKGTYYRSGETYQLSEGQFFLIYPDEMTTYVADVEEPWTYLWIGFTGNLAKRFDKLSVPIGELPKSIFLELLQMIQEDFPEWQDMREEYLATVIHKISASLFAKPHTAHHLARRVKTFVENSYVSDISVQSIADGLWVDRRYLSRLFKKYYGVSIQEYIITVRLEKAAEFLTQGFSVNECCELCGYKDRSNFSRMFYRRYHLWPSQYQKNL